MNVCYTGSVPSSASPSFNMVLKCSAHFLILKIDFNNNILTTKIKFLGNIDKNKRAIKTYVSHYKSILTLQVFFFSTVH